MLPAACNVDAWPLLEALLGYREGGVQHPTSWERGCNRYALVGSDDRDLCSAFSRWAALDLQTQFRGGLEAAMACTVAVEEVIDKHYEAQRILLKKKKREKKLLKTIEKFRLEELEHKNIALKNDAEKTKNYRSLTRGIKVITSIAIFLSKKI